MLAIRGYSSTIAQSLIDTLPPWEEAAPVERGAVNTGAERHLFCQGVLTPATITQQDKTQIADSFWANAAMTIRQCDLIFAVNTKARVCVIGSESAYSWSFDGAYAAAKAAVHRYVETKHLSHSDQQLVCLAPSIISDARMTTRRGDVQNLATREASHPKGRFLTSAEVAAWVRFLLYGDGGYCSGAVIRLNGGMHTK